MKKFKVCLWALLITATETGLAPELLPVVTVEPMIAQVRRTIVRMLKKYKIPGAAVALYVHNKSYLLHFGYANRAQKTPVTQNTIFELGSVSKVFTCLLVAQEVLRGRMNLDDAISVHVTALGKNQCLQQITLERLGTHTARLPFNAPARVKTKHDLLKHVAQWRPKSIYPLHWQYSNHGIELLRLALEEATGEMLHDLVVKNILDPLAMAPIGVHVPQAYLPYYAVGYDKTGQPTMRWNHKYMVGTAAMRASSTDMLKFLKAAIGLPGTPNLLKQAMELTQTPYVSMSHMQHGLGWEISQIDRSKSVAMELGSAKLAQRLAPAQRVYSGTALFGKTGTTHGFHTYIAAIPSRQAGIVIMLNRTLPRGYVVIKQIGKKLLLDISK